MHRVIQGRLNIKICKDWCYFVIFHGGLKVLVQPAFNYTFESTRLYIINVRNLAHPTSAWAYQRPSSSWSPCSPLNAPLKGGGHCCSRNLTIRRIFSRLQRDQKCPRKLFLTDFFRWIWGQSKFWGFQWKNLSFSDQSRDWEAIN